MNWPYRGFRVALVLYVIACLSSLACRSAAQTIDMDGEYTVTTWEGPKGASVGFGDGKIWLLKSNELISLGEDLKPLTPIPIEEIEIRSWTVGGGSIWILGKSKGFSGLHRIDSQTGKLTDTVSLQGEKYAAILYAYGSIWAAPAFVLAKGKPLLRIDPETKHVTVIGDDFKGQLVASDGKLWMLGVEDGKVRSLDPQSNKVIDDFSVGREHDNGLIKNIIKGPSKAGGYSFAISDGMLWVLDVKGLYGERHVLSGYELKTHERIAKLETDGALWGPVIWNGYVWLSTRGDPHSGHYISKIDPGLKHTVGRILIPASPGGQEANFLPPILAAEGDSLWALSGNWYSKKAPVIVRRFRAK